MKNGETEFTKWFVENYPTQTQIFDPSWHAPAIYRAAVAAIKEAEVKEKADKS